MASGIINLNNSGQTSGGGYLMGKVEWSASPNTETNKSGGVVRLYVKKASTTGTITDPTTGTWECSLTVNGENLSQKVYAGITADWVLLLEKSFTASHNSDGTKSISIAASVYGPSETAYSGLQTAGSGTAVLDTIPRASTASFSAFTLGQKGTIFINRASASFKHTLTYTFGKASGTIASGVTAASVSWPPPTSLGSQIPNAKSGTGTITLDTYSGSTKIGSKTYNFTLNVPSSAAPDVEPLWARATYYNTGTAAASIAAFVQGYSRAQVTFDSSKITTKYGATVKSYKIVCGNVTATASPYLTGVLTGTSAKITCTVTDSRGYTASGTINLTLNAYKKPALSGVSLYRANSDGTANRAGLCIYAKATMTYSSIGGKNSCTLTGFYRLQSGSYPSTGTAMTSGTGKILTTAAAVTTTYVAKIVAKDSLGNTAAYEATIPTDSVAFHIRDGGRGAAFGKYAEADNLLDVAWDLHVGGWPVTRCKLLLTRTQGWASGTSVSIPELADCDAALVFYCNGTGWSTTALRHVIVPVGKIGALESVVNFAAAAYLTMVQRQLTVASNGTVTAGEVWLKPVNSKTAAEDNTKYPYACSPYKIYGLKW